MRTYVGSHDARGRARVVIVDGAEPPTVVEIVEFLDELAEVSQIQFLGRPTPILFGALMSSPASGG